MIDIGAKIKGLRLKLGLTQEELAARTELSKGFISQLERNLTSPSIATLDDILEALGTDIASFFQANDPNEKVVFNDLNLTVEEGEFVTVIGSNGAGKSTMLSAIAGSMMPDSGRITLNGRDITYMPEVKRASFIGRVFQDPMMGTAANMWIEENLALAYRRAKPKGLRWGMPVGEEKELYKKQLARLGLGFPWNRA